jgi:hypothetical protein
VQRPVLATLYDVIPKVVVGVLYATVVVPYFTSPAPKPVWGVDVSETLVGTKFIT